MENKAIFRTMKLAALLFFVGTFSVYAENSSEARAAANDNSAQFAQAQRAVTGFVRDAEGNPLVGVVVLVKGTNTMTVTDANGGYSISVASNDATLVFQQFGLITQELPVGGRSSVDATLLEDVQSIDDVVVVGYGVMRKSDVTGSISVVKGADMEKNQNFSAIDNLRGKAAGVNIFSNAGQPGMYAPRVIIRGASSIQASTDPLYVVDGVVTNDFYLMNPNDIESIEVLKDASSAAIYGARGANGVILVTTKRGVRGGGTRVSYEGNVQISSPQRYMSVMNAEEWVEAFQIGLQNGNKWRGKKVTEDLTYYLDDPDYFKNGKPIYDTDWQKEATRTSISHSHQLNIQHGGDDSSIGAFLGYTDNQGIMNNTWMKRVSGRMAWDANPLKWLSTSVNLSINHSYGRRAEETGGGQEARRTMIEMMPWYPVYDKNGNYTNYGSSTVASKLGMEGMMNPVAILDLQKRMIYNTQIRGNAALTFHLLEGLDLYTQLAISNSDRAEKMHSSNTLTNISSPNGWAIRTNRTTFNWEEKVYLTYKKQFGDSRLDAMAGTEWFSETFDTATMESRNFADFWEWYNMGAGLDQRANSSSWRQYTMHSVFARVAYSYKNRYSATVTARLDGSSKFGDNNKYAFFPSVGLAWNVSNEDFMADNRTISNLKLHTSYGLTGNSEITPYKSLSTVTANTALLDGSRQGIQYISAMANPNLQWEKTGMWDIGVELGLFKQRLNFDVSYYFKNTTDLLLDAPVPRTTGFSTIARNVGAVRNTGVDIMITGIPVQTDDFTWSANLNMNYNKNKVTKLADGNADIEQLSWVGGSNAIVRVGENMNSFYGYIREGVYTVEDIAADKDLDPTLIGQAKRTNDKHILGKGTPDWAGSLINNFSYKNFDLSIDFQFVMGVETMQQFYHSTYDRFGITNGLTNILYDAYDGTNPGAMQQAIYLCGPKDTFGVDQNTLVDSQWVVNGSYLRLNQVLLGYRFSSNVCKSLGLSALRLYVSGNNLFLLTAKDFTGYDPESTSQGDNKFGQGLTFFSYPRARTFMAGVQVTF